MCRVQQKISQGLDVLTFFSMREWVFDSTRFQEVFKELDNDDKEMYVNKFVYAHYVVIFLQILHGYENRLNRNGERILERFTPWGTYVLYARASFNIA